MTPSRVSALSGPSGAALMIGLPRLVVKMKTQLRQSTRRPELSVTRPSSRILRNRSTTSCVSRQPSLDQRCTDSSHLLDLIDEHDREGLSPDVLGQEAGARVVPNVSGRSDCGTRSSDAPWRSTDEAGDGVPLGELGAVEAQHRVLAVELKERERLGQLGLACLVSANRRG